MNKKLLITICVTLVCLFSIGAKAQVSAPYFTSGTTGTLSVCESSTATPINTLLEVMDADTSETETWSTLATPAHGTLVAAYSTTSTGAALTPTGLTYMPTTAYVGADTFSVQVTDGTFMDTIMVYVTVNPLPHAGTISSASGVCVAASTTVSGTGTGGSWSLTNSNATLSGSTLTGASAGVDTIRYIVTNGCGSDTAMRAITINPLPVSGTISGGTSVCVGATITLSSTAGGGSWSSSNATANITGGGVVTGLAAGIDTITYFVVNGCGVAYSTAIITINPLPHAGTITGATSVCVGSAIIVANSTSGGTWGITNSNATLATDTVTGVTPGMDTVTYTVTTVCGTDVTTRAITINPLPVAGTVSGPSVVCEGASIIDTASVTGGTWSAVNTNATVTGGVVTGAAGGMDTILYSVTNVCGTASASHVVTINPLPTVGTLSGASTVCVGASITLSATLAGGVWSASNGTASLADSVVTGVTTGIDTIRYSFTNVCGTRSATQIVTITGVPHAGPITGPDRVCIGSTVTLSAPTSGTWSAFNGAVTVSGGVVTGIAFGRDTIMNIATNSCGSDTAYHFDRVDTVAPHVSMITGPYIVCQLDTIRVTDSVAGGRWAVTNSNATINSTGRVRGITAGIDTVLYIATNGCGADTADYVVTINPAPNAGAITGYDSVCQGGSITLHDATTGGAWVSDNSAFADVDTAGHVSGYLHGSVLIYYIVSNSCGSDSAIKRVNINIPAGPITGPSTLCQGATSLLIDAVTGGTWSTPIISWLVIGPVIGGTVIGITAGTATVTYTVHNACGTSTATLDIEVIVCPSSVTDIKNTEAALSVSPNPGAGHFTITLPFSTNDMANVTVTNMLGEQIKTFALPGNKSTEVELNVPAGVYLLSATLNNEKYTTRVIVTE